MSFSLKHIRYFVATSAAGQVSRAARELNISQSAVTAAIQQLEGIVGFSLLDRHAGGVSLTVAGARFLQRAEHILAAVDDALRVSSDDPVSTNGRLRVGMTYTVAGYFAVPLIARARRIFPNIDIMLTEDHRQVIEEKLAEGSLDLAIILTSNLKNTMLLRHKTLVASKRQLWLPSEHELSSVGGISLKDVIRYPYIALTVDEAIETQRSYWGEAGVMPDVVFHTTSVEAVRTMVAAGMGITVLSDMVYRPWSLEGQRIERRAVTGQVPAMDVGLVWNPERPMRPGAPELMDFLSAACGTSGA